MDINPEVRKFFAEIGRKNGKKLFAERGSQYFKDIAGKRKRFGRLPKPKIEDGTTYPY